MSDVTQILEAAQQGDASAAERLLPVVYEELRRLAAHKMVLEQPGHTLQPTALVHEAWLRLFNPEEALYSHREREMRSPTGQLTRKTSYFHPLKTAETRHRMGERLDPGNLA